MSPSRFSIVTAIALVSLQLASFGGVTRHDRDPQLYLNMATQASYAPVGHIGFAEGSNLYAGSGTLIAPGWVLTAGHVVANATSRDFTIGGNPVHMYTEYIHENADAGARLVAHVQFGWWGSFDDHLHDAIGR